MDEYIRQLKEIDDFSAVLMVQKEVWAFEDIEIIPEHVFKDATGLLSPNGTILGYFMKADKSVEEKLVGYIMTFPTSNPGEVLVEMLAVLPDFQGKGIGFKLNLELRKIMLDLNINKLLWTYDPLESVNANLYIRKLGGIITHHFVDYYGMIDSKIHSGIPTDRFLIEWDIKSEYVENRIKNGNIEIRKDEIDKMYNGKDPKYVEIPLNFQELKTNNIDIAMDYRLKTRKLFDEYIEKQKYIGVDFFLFEQKGIYVFKKIER